MTGPREQEGLQMAGKYGKEDNCRNKTQCHFGIGHPDPISLHISVVFVFVLHIDTRRVPSIWAWLYLWF